MLAPKIKLNNGEEMPIIGLGTWRSTSKEAEQAVEFAIDAGYRHIDTAFVYENEMEIGRAIKSKISEGVVQREDLFIVTKLAGIHHEPKLVEHACRLSLRNLGLTYVDLYLMHMPIGMHYVNDETLHNMPSQIDYLDTYKAMEKLVQLGLAKSIGLSNFNRQQTERIVQNCAIKPVTNQVECHPAFNQRKLIEFSKQHGIVVTAYCPLGRPKPKYRSPDFMYSGRTEKLSKKYSKTASQIVLRYLIQSGVIPIPKSVHQGRIVENFNVFDFELSPDDMEIMDSFNTDHRMIPFSGLDGHQYYPFNAEY